MDNYEDIARYIESLLEIHGSVDVAESEFKRMLVDDDLLREAYHTWCSENGYTQRNGFSDYAHEYNEGRESIWDTLSDYDDND